MKTVKLTEADIKILQYIEDNKLSTEDGLKLIQDIYTATRRIVLENYPEKEYLYKLLKYIQNNDIDNVKILLNKSLNVSLNWILNYTIDFYGNNIKIIKLLLNDKRVDYTCFRTTFSIEKAYNDKNIQVLNTLWQYQKAKQSVFNYNIELYNQINTLLNINNF